jgi:hypothetical protein
MDRFTFENEVRNKIEAVIDFLHEAPEASDGRSISLVKTKLQEAQLWVTQI